LLGLEPKDGFNLLFSSGQPAVMAVIRSAVFLLCA